MDTTTQTFTKQQLNDFVAYERVRASGQFNMFFHGARDATGLSKDAYFFVLKNFSKLQSAYESAKNAKG